MIKVLIVEDDIKKLGRIKALLITCNVPTDCISYALDVSEALLKLSEHRYDLLVLDVNVPLRSGEQARRGGGVELLRHIADDGSIKLPQFIIGLTAYKDAAKEFDAQFSDQLWSLIHYNPTEDVWSRKIRAKVDYLIGLKSSNNFSDGVTHGIDLGIVVALDSVELTAILDLPLQWQKQRIPFDDTIYHTGTITKDERLFTVVAAAAPRMGMPSASALTSKMIFTHRPRFLAMAGIAAGRASKVNIGDVIVADDCWDYGSGKIESKDGAPVFKPAPHHLDLDTDLRSLMKELGDDTGLMMNIRDKWRGPKPDTVIKGRVGPLATGSAVVANKDIFDQVVDQHRNVLGLEMEAYAVLNACRSCSKPRPVGMIVKGICDFADADKADDFQAYAAHNSAWFLYESALRFL